MGMEITLGQVVLSVLGVFLSVLVGWQNIQIRKALNDGQRTREDYLPREEHRQLCAGVRQENKEDCQRLEREKDKIREEMLKTQKEIFTKLDDIAKFVYTHAGQEAKAKA